MVCECAVNEDSMVYILNPSKICINDPFCYNLKYGSNRPQLLMGRPDRFGDASLTKIGGFLSPCKMSKPHRLTLQDLEKRQVITDADSTGHGSLS